MEENEIQQDSQQEHEQRIEHLKAELVRQQDQADEIRKSLRQTIKELAKEEISVVVPSDEVMDAARKMGPMDDPFFNRLGEDKEAIGEDCYLGKKGVYIDIEVQKNDKDDHEFRVYYNGASIIVNNTPKGTRYFRNIPRAVVIYISEFDVFGEGEMYYEVHKVIKKSGTPRRSPVTEIYINTENEDRSDERMEKIADLMKVFKDPDLYDYDRFPKFSQRKWELKNTEKGVMEVGKEVQQIVDREKAESARIARVEGRAEGEKKGQKDTANLMSFLVSNGRGDDVVKASQDESFLNKLLAEFRGGMMVVK